jgi:hypothetical protein
MTNPNRYIFDGLTGQSVEQEMTEEEYADLIASGWTPGDEANPDPEPTPEEETPEE